MAAGGARFEQHFDLGAQRRELGGEPVGVVAVGQVLAVGGDHLPGELDELHAAAAGRARALGDLDQLADDVTPAKLLLQDVEKVVAGVAIGHDKPPELLAEQLLGRGLGSCWVDPKARDQRRGRDPQPLLRSGQAPRRLIGMDDPRPADRLAQLSPRVGEHRAHPHDRAIDRPLTRWDPEHLHHDLANLIAREPKHAGEHRDMRIQPRTEPRTSTRREPSERRALTRRAAQPQPDLLKHQRNDHRQLVLLMDDRIPDPLLAAIKLVPATATVRNMLKALIDPLGGDELPALALVTGLTAGLAHRALIRLPRQPPTLRPRLRRIRRGRHAAIPRITVDLALKLLDPLAQRRVLGPQLNDQPRQLLTARP